MAVTVQLAGMKYKNSQGQFQSADALKGDPTDVQINGTSIVSAGVANIPVASTSNYGVVKVNSNKGIQLWGGDTLAPVPAQTTSIKNGTEAFQPITPSFQHNSAFYGLAKAAGDTSQSSSSNAVGAYTEDAKFAIAQMLGLPYEKLLYRDDTFGNIWTEYQPTDIDVANNAIVLSDATGLPTDEISPSGTGYLILKPLLTVQYGTMPTELYGWSRIKCIGDNKIQFYKTDGTLVTITSTDYIDMTKFKLIYRSSNTQPTRPLCNTFDPTHKIHVRLSGYMLENAVGVKALDANGNHIKGSAYGASTTGHIGQILYGKSNDTTTGMSAYDSYGCIIGNRAFDSNIYNNKYAFGQYDIWFYPNQLFGGCEMEMKTCVFGVDTSNKNKIFHPCISIGHGFTNAQIASVEYTNNSSSAWVGPGAKFEVWDCGTNY